MMSIPLHLQSSALAVHTRGLTKQYGKQLALSDVEVMVPEHGFYVLVGPNGAGKSTLLKLLLEIIHPTRGSVNVLGMDAMKEGARIRANVGYVSERGDDLYLWMKAEAALAFHRRYYPTWDAAYAADLLKRLQVKNGKLSRMSKGEARRVQLIMALAHRPALLIMDEPTDGLDPVGREIFLGILAEHIATTPTTVLVSTHLAYEMERLADHFAVLRDGKLLAQTTTDELKRRLKRYVVHTMDGVAPPAEAFVVGNGDARERAWTLWGEESTIASQLQHAGATVHDVKALSLQEAAVAFLSREDV